MKSKKNLVLLIICFAAFAVLPFVIGTYYTNFVVTIALFAVFSVSFNMLLGYTGILNFGHAIFFGSGAYGIALALKHIEGLSLFSALGLGILSAVAMALLLCPIAVRLGHSFAMWHLAVNLFMVVIAFRLRTITGGEDGIANFPIPPLKIPGLFSLPIGENPLAFYYFAMAISAISLFLMWHFTKTPFGQIQIGVRDNAQRVEYLGFKVLHSRAVVYVISAAFAGLAGSIHALFSNLVSPEGSLLVFYVPIVNTIVGGAGSFFGPILGTAVVQTIEEFCSRYIEQTELVTGVIIVVVMLFAPMGLTGLITKIKVFLKDRWQNAFHNKSKLESLL